MNLVLISPRLALQKGDFLGSGIPYWPIELATLAAHARQEGDSVIIIDQFGADPSRLADGGDHYLQGVEIRAPRWRNNLERADAFILYAISYMAHQELIETTKWLKRNFSSKPVAILENSQAVTAYSLSHTAKSFLGFGADLIICGEPYRDWQSIRQCLQSNNYGTTAIPCVIHNQSQNFNVSRAKKLGRYPAPAWDLINLEGYWRLPYSHGPKTDRFLPILTSRGCPYPCDFCVVPETNNRKWQGNDPEHVVDEIIELRDRYSVFDFHVEDLNPTVQHQRWERICELLIKRRANVRFYFVSGTKAETIRVDKVPLFARAGCRYVSISPESGSEPLMKVIGKKFDKTHAAELVKACRKYGIRTQACFLIGHPEETQTDFLASKNYLIELVSAGLDEVAVFMVAAFAGSSLFTNSAIEMDDKSALPSFSPRGRSEYKVLQARRRKLILTFFIAKLKSGVGLWMQIFRSAFGTPQTKMENLPRRILYITWLILKSNYSSSGPARND